MIREHDIALAPLVQYLCEEFDTLVSKYVFIVDLNEKWIISNLLLTDNPCQELNIKGVMILQNFLDQKTIEPLD